MNLAGSLNWDYWLDEIMPSMTGLEIQFAIKHIRGAAIDFCEQSYAWRFDPIAININANQRQYSLSASFDDTEIVRVEQVFVSGKQITVTSMSGLAQHNINFINVKGTPTQYTQEFTERISLYPLPDKGIVGGLTYKISLRPSRIADGMHDSIGKRYFDAIAHGAKARLLEIPSKPWSDPNLAAYHRAKFDMVVARARDEVSSGYGRGAKRVVRHT